MKQSSVPIAFAFLLVACGSANADLLQPTRNRSIAGSDYDRALKEDEAFEQRIAGLMATAEAKPDTREGAEARLGIIQAYRDKAAQLPGPAGLPRVVREQCEAIIRDCAAMPDVCALARKSLGDYYASHRGFDAAAAEYTKVITDYPATPGAALANVARAECLASPMNAARDPDTAAVRLNAILPEVASCPLADAQARLRIGDVQVMRDQPAAAEEAYLACVARRKASADPDIGDVVAGARQHLALCYGHAGEYGRGADVLEELVAQYSGRGLRDQWGHSTRRELVFSPSIGY
jgi:hypothetical protein